MDRDTIYCRHCSYALSGVVPGTCPECGCVFDPSDLKTYRRRPEPAHERLLFHVFTFHRPALTFAFVASTAIIGNVFENILAGLFLASGCVLLTVTTVVEVLIDLPDRLALRNIEAGRDHVDVEGVRFTPHYLATVIWLAEFDRIDVRPVTRLELRMGRGRYIRPAAEQVLPPMYAVSIVLLILGVVMCAATSSDRAWIYVMLLGVLVPVALLMLVSALVTRSIVRPCLIAFTERGEYCLPFKRGADWANIRDGMLAAMQRFPYELSITDEFVEEARRRTPTDDDESAPE